MYIYDENAYTWNQAGTQNGGAGGDGLGGEDGDEEKEDSNTTTDDSTDSYGVRSPIVIQDSDGNTLMSIVFSGISKDVDNEGARTIPSTGDVFILQHRVNDFSGVK